MIPTDPGVLEEEIYTQRGESSLPVTRDLEDADNMELIFNFLFLLHKGKCLGRNNNFKPRNDDECIPNCMFVRQRSLQAPAKHYQKCVGDRCPQPYCRQAVAMVDHWRNCDQDDCFICSSTANLILESFCTYLGRRGPGYELLVVQVQNTSLANKKKIVQMNISIVDS